MRAQRCLLLRQWQLRALGPGAFVGSTQFQVPSVLTSTVQRALPSESVSATHVPGSADPEQITVLSTSRMQFWGRVTSMPVPIPAAPGILNWLPAPGQVVARDEALYAVGEHPVRTLYGQTPLWRDLHQGIQGADVRQLPKTSKPSVTRSRSTTASARVRVLRSKRGSATAGRRPRAHSRPATSSSLLEPSESRQPMGCPVNLPQGPYFLSQALLKWSL